MAKLLERREAVAGAFAGWVLCKHPELETDMDDLEIEEFAEYLAEFECDVTDIMAAIRMRHMSDA